MASSWDVAVSLKGIWFDNMNVFYFLEQYSENVPVIHAWKLETATFYTYATTEKLKTVGSPVSHWNFF